MVNFNEVHKIENDIVINAKALDHWIEVHTHNATDEVKQVVDHLITIIEATTQVKKLNAEAEASSYVAAENPISIQPVSGIEDTHSDASVGTAN